MQSKQLQLLCTVEISKRTKLFTSGEQRLLFTNSMLKAIGFYRICGRMLGHIFIYSNLQLHSVSPLLLAMLLGEEPLPTLDDLYEYEPMMAQKFKKVCIILPFSDMGT